MAFHVVPLFSLLNIFSSFFIMIRLIVWTGRVLLVKYCPASRERRIKENWIKMLYLSTDLFYGKKKLLTKTHRGRFFKGIGSDSGVFLKGRILVNSSRIRNLDISR